MRPVVPQFPGHLGNRTQAGRWVISQIESLLLAGDLKSPAEREKYVTCNVFGFLGSITSTLVSLMNDFSYELPSYTHLPGRTPHPISDPQGHSYGKPVEGAHDLETCLKRGMSLFQNGYFWEAHEAWEQAWILLGRQGAAADFVKGYIKLAASGVKCLVQHRTGAERHLRRARQLLSSEQKSSADREDIQQCLPRPETLIQAIQHRIDSIA